ncbi:MAG TPA: 50S ribosomal protein L17 [Gemmataceae bacterium]|nr:50S ribosomal protein L17 [Gemmataceae bacterium]
MRHRNAGRTLGRNATHRQAMFRNLTMALFEKERIVTTVAKAKEVRPFVEKLITLAKHGNANPEKSLHMRRLVLSRLGTTATVRVRDSEGKVTKVTILQKLFNEIAPRYTDRPGGYTRIVKRHERRLGDAGHTALLELLKAGETKVRARAPSALPAPAPTPKTETPEQTAGLPLSPPPGATTEPTPTPPATETPS